MILGLSLVKLVPARAWIGALAVLLVLASVWRYGEARYNAGYADRDAHYAARVEALNKANDDLESELAAAEAAADAANRRLFVDALGGAGSDQCRIIPTEQLVRLNAIR